jgi:hypothetical protein
MLKALMLKELHETAWIALVGLLAQLAFVDGFLPFWSTGSMGDFRYQIPFLGDNFLGAFGYVSVFLAVALGLRQTVWESRGGTWLFLLHRPASLRRVLAAKLLVGGGLYLLCGLIAILSYAAWAAMPGRHASPFRWWMTANAWAAWGLIAIVYLSAFLTGIRPARWFGTRLLPLVAGGTLALMLCFTLAWPPVGVAVFLLMAAGLVGLINFSAQSRDFS